VIYREQAPRTIVDSDFKIAALSADALEEVLVEIKCKY